MNITHCPLCGEVALRRRNRIKQNPPEPKLGVSREHDAQAPNIAAWITNGLVYRDAADMAGSAKWRVLLAAFWDVTQEKAEQRQWRPDHPQWDIVTLRSALENYGRHHEWCDFGPDTPCNCGYNAAIKVGEYAMAIDVMTGGVSTPAGRQDAQKASAE